jgi:hypothetical protein
MDEKNVLILDAPPALPSGAGWYGGLADQGRVFHAYQNHKLEAACSAPRPLWAVGLERAVAGSTYCTRCCRWAGIVAEFHGSAAQVQEGATIVLPVPPPLPNGVDWRGPLAAVGTGSNGQPVALEPTFHAVPEVRADGVHKDALCGQPRPSYPHLSAAGLAAAKRRYCAVCLRFANITVPTHLRDEGFLVKPQSDPFSRYPQALRSEQPNEFHAAYGESQFNQTLMGSYRVTPDRYGTAARWSSSEPQIQNISRSQLQRLLSQEQASQLLNTPLIPLGFPWPVKCSLGPNEDRIPRPWLALLLKEPRPAGHVQSWYRREEGGREVFYGRPKDPAMRHVRVTPEQIAHAVRDDKGWPVAPAWGRLRDIIQTAFFEYHPDNPPAKKPSKKEQNFFWSPEDQADTIAKDQVFEP